MDEPCIAALSLMKIWAIQLPMNESSGSNSAQPQIEKLCNRHDCGAHPVAYTDIARGLGLLTILFIQNKRPLADESAAENN
jgi:hypothetical protein